MTLCHGTFWSHAIVTVIVLLLLLNVMGMQLSQVMVLTSISPVEDLH